MLSSKFEGNLHRYSKNPNQNPKTIITKTVVWDFVPFPPVSAGEKSYFLFSVRRGAPSLFPIIPSAVSEAPN